MKRTLLTVALVTLWSTGVMAAEHQRYLVATKRPFRAGALAAVLRDARAGIVQSDVIGFETFDGFSAALTSSDVAALRRSSEVRWVEPVIERYAVAETRNYAGQTIPYGVELVHAREAWKGRRTAVINVAVLDTGVDFRHPELTDIYAGGYNFYEPAGPPLDDGSHGTHVAGTIAAADNAIGVVGIAPQSQTRLWAVKVLNSSGSGTNETIVRGIDWVVNKKKEIGGHWIINMSLGSKSGSAAEAESVRRALDAGVIITAAAGNDSQAQTKVPVIYPAAYDGVLAVAAVDEAETVADFSNQGPQLDLAAPGVRVLSTIPLGINFLANVAAGGSTFNADPLDGSGSGTVTAEFVDCGLGHPDQFPASVRGRIAVIQRGEITFAAKARNAVSAGAIAVVISNNATSSINWTLRSEQDPWSLTYDFPLVVALTKTDGEALRQKSGPLTITTQPDDYAVFNGTSMAAPHVAGAAALIWSMAPEATSSEVVNALLATAIDRGERGPDPAYGSGVIDVLSAARRLAPYAFATPPSTGRPIGRRGRG